MCKAIGYDSLSEPPGFLLGTSWTVRIAMLMYRKKKKTLAQSSFSGGGVSTSDCGYSYRSVARPPIIRAIEYEKSQQSRIGLPIQPSREESYY
jgi:hypothetical protein